MQDRSVVTAIEELAFAAKKMAFLSGPRQVGKTTVGKLLQRGRTARYATWDDVVVRRQWARDPRELVPRAAHGERTLLVLDEIHKARLWKRSLKGLWDTSGDDTDVLVTGSARLNVYRKGSDSLLGRYLAFRLHPFSVNELETTAVPSPDELVRAATAGVPAIPARADAVGALLRFGGFPEPFLAASERRARLWRRARIDAVIREDLRDLSRIPDLSRVEMLAALLCERVGSPLSLNSLREDLEVAHDTVKNWVSYLNELFYVFEVKPWHRSIRRALRKEGKVYLWDWAEVDEPGARFENFVASQLAKACDTWTDTGEGTFALHYLRDKEKREIDFLIVRDKRPWIAVEAKRADTSPSPSWRAFLPQLGVQHAVQLVATGDEWRWHQVGGSRVLVASAARWLALLP